MLALVRSINHPEYRQRLSERLGWLPRQFNPGGIVIHGASVGEVLALKPFIERCLSQFEHLPITVTTFTPTGSAQVKKLFGKRVQHCYLPLDIWPCSSLFLKKLSPKAIVIMETELWPNLITQASKLGIKQLLINGRISDKSFGSYQRFSPLVAPSLKKFDQIQAQSKENAQRFIALGARPEACMAAGNLKFDIKVGADVERKQADIASLLPSNRPILLLASSHEGDEQLALHAFQLIEQQCENPLLIIVPRHPERFDKVATLLSSQNISFQRRSEAQIVAGDTKVWLMDSLGELMAVFNFADTIIMGGTFSTIGGHNPLEPALFKKPIITGSDMANFKEIHQLLSNANGVVTLADENIAVQLSERVSQLFADNKLAAEIGENAYQVVQQNQGATDTALAELAQLIQSKN